MSIPNLRTIFLSIFQQGWILLLHCYQFSYCRGQQPWLHVRHLIPCKDKQALQNHIFKEETAERIPDCIALCTAYPGCHSSNSYRIDKRCELNDKTHASHPEDMLHVPYTIYMENIFRPMPCSNNLDCGKAMICSPFLFCEGMPCAKVMLQFKRLIQRTSTKDGASYL